MATGLQRQPAPSSGSTIDPAEVARFAAIAAEWWDEKGKFAPLHRMNPVRIGYIRDQVIGHFSRDGESATPFNNLSLLDVGCGGGLISEPMARLGAQTTGVDAALENIKVASLHAQQGGLIIDYRCNSAEELAAEILPLPLEGGGRVGVAQPQVATEYSLADAPPPPSPNPSPQGRGISGQFDVVLALEIIEHVANPDLFYRSLIQLVKPGGLLILSTLNRTAKSYAMAIVGAEIILRWLPRGTHAWEKFIKPSEMASSLSKLGVTVTDTNGLVFNPLAWSFSLNPRDLDVNYLMTAQKPV